MTIDLRMASADTLAQSVRPGSLAILLVTRPEIERGTAGDVVDRLMAMSDSAAVTRNLAGSVVIQVDGYNDDPRELMEIREVCEFFQHIDAQWSFWAHFLDTRLTDTFNMLIGLLIRPQRQFLNGGVIGYEYDPDEVEAFLIKQIRAAWRLHELHDLPVAGFRKRMHQVLCSIYGPSASEAVVDRILNAGMGNLPTYLDGGRHTFLRMWHPKPQQYERPDGTAGKIGWILVDDAGEPYQDPEHGGIVTDFAPEPMQALAAHLNALQPPPRG